MNTGFEKEKIDKENKDCKKNIMKYGEFISSYFAWVSPDKQREIVERLEKITKDRKD